MKRASRSIEYGFTLIELLVVMAITTILFGLIFGPMVQGFNLTNRARVQILAQDSARQAMELAQRDVSNGVFVFHNYPDASQLLPNTPNPEAPEPNSVSLWVRDSGGVVRRILLANSMIDFVPVARVKDQNIVVGEQDIDPTTGLAINRGDVAVPLAPGRVIIRYWLGLRENATEPTGPLNGRPLKPYGNYYDNPRETPFNQHNPVLLYRAVISPYMPNLDANNQAQVDRRLFATRTDPATGREVPVIYDPNFFYDDTEAGAVLLANGATTNRVDGWRDDNGDGRANIAENWRAVARSMVPADRADQVVVTRDNQGNPFYVPTSYDPQIQVPQITPQARFQPSYVGNDAGAPSTLGDVGNEMPQVAPSSFREAYGHWVLPYKLYVFRSLLSDTLLRYFFEQGDGRIYYQEYDTQSGQYSFGQPGQLTTFQLDARGQLAAGTRPEIMFRVDPRRGIVNFAFPDSIVLHDSAGNYYPSEFYPEEANGYYDAAVQAGEDGYRYISLAKLDTPAPAGEVNTRTFNFQSPLEIMPDGRYYIPNVSIVPGSEVVVGPDQRPGPHFGQPITYTRVPRTGDPLSIGPNEYMINYTDQVPNPDPTNPDPNLHPILRAGTVIFDSRPDSPGGERHSIPPFLNPDPMNPGAPPVRGSLITVSYQIQNNLPTDVVKADYLTRSLMSVVLGVRLYEFNSGQPQQVTLTQKIHVRNLQR